MIKESEKDTFLAIDANAIVHRAFHAYPSTLQTPDGVQVNAVYGFTVMLLEAFKMFEPKYVLCAMDTHAPTFRHEIYVDYKATRKPTDLSLVDQFPLVEEILKAFNIPVIKKEGFEADDILGTISKYVSEGKWSKENIDLYILSGDRDLLQLINERTYVCLPNGNFKNIVVYDEKKTFEKFGYYPRQVVDYKALVGDPSDNIPGIKGIGDKTAINLLQKFGSLDEIYKNIDKIEGKTKTLLIEGVEQAEFSRKLATIEQNVDIDIHLTDCILKDLDRRTLDLTFKKYAFKSLMSKLDEIFGKVPSLHNSHQLDMFSKINGNIRWSSIDDVKKLVSKSRELRVVYIDESESYDNKAFILLRAIGEDNFTKDILLEPCDILDIINGKSCVFYNFEELTTLSPYISIHSVSDYFDVLLAQHLLHSEKRNVSLKDLAFDYSSKVLNEKISITDISEVLDTIEDAYIAQLKEMDELELYDYTKESIERILKVHEKYLLAVLKEVELPISIILSRMERRGFALDVDKLLKLKKEVEDEIRKIEKEIYSIVGHEFNISSPKQLSDVLFKELGLPNKSKGSTRESVLDDMLGTHPIVEQLLYYRDATKMLSTYIDPLYSNSIPEEEGIRSIHTDFKQTGTTSGRFSSVNPNLQNIPLEGAWANSLRECFVARKGFKLLGMDYAQMELRIMADISDDKLLKKDFINGLDIHSATAARVLNKKMSEITHKERSLGKVVNFGMIFGQTAFGLASLLGVDRETASKYISSYFEHYKGVEEYMRKIEYEAFKKGYVQTMFGTTRHIAGIRSKNVRLRSASAREAINMPIQGSEADIMKFVMKKLYELIEEKYSKEAYILLQIHDEIIMEVKESVVEEFSKEAKKIMLESVSLDVPLDVHVSVGNCMAELK
ncbi:MAG TPA: DNA polymerase I [Candidatus Dojkabacteria bacterium]|nr:DNA polymerase I [Candidatus Dojkabacteria bacterium]